MQKRSLKHYKMPSFDAFLCEETIDTSSYKKKIKKATWVIDLKRGNHYWSKELYEMMGIAPGITPNIMMWVTYLQPEDRLKFYSCFNQMEDGKAREFTFSIIHPYQAKKVIKCCMEAISQFNDGEIEIIVGTCFDITHSDFFEKGKISKLQEENDLNRKLLSIISHDLKNPFSTIIGLVEFLLLKGQIHDMKKTELYLQTILSGARNAHTMLIRLMEWAKAQNGSWHIQPIHLDLYVLIQEVFEELKIVAGAKEIELYIGCEKGITVFTDSEMLRIVLRNLVSNAIKFSFRRSQVIVDIVRKSDVKISVIDFGIGMEESDIGRIFKSEINEPGLGTADETGTGIGISICRTIVEKLGGRIWAESKLGSGCSFYITLPV